MSVAVSVEAVECPLVDKGESPLPNWELAKLLHSQRVALKEICDRCNVRYDTLQKRIAREGWVERRQQASAVLSVTLKQTGNSQSVEVQAQETKSNELSSTLLQRMRSRLDYITEGWDSGKKQKPLKTDSERIKALSLLNQAADIGKTLFGWGQSTGSVALNVTFLKHAQVSTAPEQPKLADAAVIDVQQVADVPTIVTSRD